MGTGTSLRAEPVPVFASASLPRAAAQGSAPAKWWGDEFELVVNLETNRPDTGSGPYRRPYVVVYIEDEQGLSVRTVSLWVSMGGAGPDQWLPDLRRWYRGDERRSRAAKKNMAYTIARPTRPPGQYTVAWDGKDDDGKPVPAGNYTVFIEAVREHGTHQLMRASVKLGGEPSRESLQGDVEIRSAEVEYRRKSAGR